MTQRLPSAVQDRTEGEGIKQDLPKSRAQEAQTYAGVGLIIPALWPDSRAVARVAERAVLPASPFKPSSQSW